MMSTNLSKIQNWLYFIDYTHTICTCQEMWTVLCSQSWMFAIFLELYLSFKPPNYITFLQLKFEEHPHHIEYKEQLMKIGQVFWKSAQKLLRPSRDSKQSAKHMDSFFCTLLKPINLENCVLSKYYTNAYNSSPDLRICLCINWSTWELSIEPNFKSFTLCGCDTDLK